MSTIQLYTTHSIRLHEVIRVVFSPFDWFPLDPFLVFVHTKHTTHKCTASVSSILLCICSRVCVCGERVVFFRALFLDLFACLHMDRCAMGVLYARETVFGLCLFDVLCNWFRHFLAYAARCSAVACWWTRCLCGGCCQLPQFQTQFGKLSAWSLNGVALWSTLAALTQYRRASFISISKRTDLNYERMAYCIYTVNGKKKIKDLF